MSDQVAESDVQAMLEAIRPGQMTRAEAVAALRAAEPHLTRWNRMRAAQAMARVLYAGWSNYRTAGRVGCLGEADTLARAVRYSRLRICIDADCPGCGWPERWYSPTRQVFGCPKCPHESTERNN